VFCWRDQEQGNFGSQWIGPVDDPKLLAEEMIRHTKNIIFTHITKEKSLQNFDLMRKVLTEILRANETRSDSQSVVEFTENQMSKLTHSTINKVHQAMLLLKNCDVLDNPALSTYQLSSRVVPELKALDDVDKILKRDVTTKEDIEKAFEEANNLKHAAISLAGEPSLYPRIGELVQEFRNRHMSTFIVTNGTHPEVIRKLWQDKQLPTQLYVTVPAPNHELYLKVCRPMEANTWEKLNETLNILPQLPCRTVIRITAVKYLNIDLSLVPAYTALFKANTPNFIDIKGFTVEANALEMQKRWKGEHELREYIPSYEDLFTFAKALESQGGFEIIETHEGSRDILLRGSWPKGKSIKIDYTDFKSL
jgi:wyosine [tRNA(Phe)-imidazoG37] synthetase (radical SAM superfamily)